MHFHDIWKTFVKTIQDLSRCFTYYTNFFRISKTPKKISRFLNCSILLKYFRNLTQLCTILCLLFLVSFNRVFREAPFKINKIWYLCCCVKKYCLHSVCLLEILADIQISKTTNWIMQTVYLFGYKQKCDMSFPICRRRH